MPHKNILITSYFHIIFTEENVCENEIQIVNEEKCNLVEDEECQLITEKQCSVIEEEVGFRRFLKLS